MLIMMHITPYYYAYHRIVPIMMHIIIILLDNAYYEHIMMHIMPYYYEYHRIVPTMMHICMHTTG